MTAPPTVEAARELGLDTFQPESVNTDQARARIAAEQPDVLVVCAYGALIRAPLLSDHRILNVHPSLLPRWRGAAPIERAVLAGDTETGVSIMLLKEGLDSGPVCLQARLPIDRREDSGALATKLEGLGGDLLVQALDEEAAGADPARCSPQDDTLATYAEKLTAEDRRLDPTGTAAGLELRVRALSPHLGAFVELADGTRLGVGRARAEAAPRDAGAGDETATADVAPGTILTDGPTPVLVCGDGLLRLLAVQPPGKRMMDAGDYLRGLRR